MPLAEICPRAMTAIPRDEASALQAEWAKEWRKDSYAAFSHKTAERLRVPQNPTIDVG